MLDRIIAIERKFRDYVTKEAHMPVRIAMFGFIALICAGMITAIIAQVIRK